jgi:hypothetical protein
VIGKSRNVPFNGVKVFHATLQQARDRLGEVVTAWIEAHPTYEVRDIVVTQSSDREFHCVTISIFYWEPLGKR